MADISSFMDWSPQTPPVPHNPYQGLYMPGGWPVDPPTSPQPTTGIFARREPEGLFLPAAKRVCSGLGHALGVGYHTFQAVTVQTFNATSVRLHAVVRQVRQQQHRRAQRPERQRRLPPAPRQSLPQTPQQETNTRVGNGPQTEQLVPPEAPSETPQLTTLQNLNARDATPQHGTPRATAVEPENIPPCTQVHCYFIPEFRPDYVLEKIRHATEADSKSLKTRGFHRRPKLTTRKPGFFQPHTSEAQLRMPQSECGKLQIPYPPLLPGSTIPPSTATTTTTEPATHSFQLLQEADSATPSAQLLRELRVASEIAETEGDSDSSTLSITTIVLGSKKRRIRRKGSGTKEEGQTPDTIKYIHTEGPSLSTPETPTPVIVVHDSTTAATTAAPAQTDETLLTPPRQRRRRIRTPFSSKTCKAHPQTPKILESDISSTCNISPGPEFQPHSPAKSDISSTWNGSPPDLEADARLQRLIMAGGGSPTTETQMSISDKAQGTIQPNIDATQEHASQEFSIQTEITAAADITSQSSSHHTSTVHEASEDTPALVQQNVTPEPCSITTETEPEVSTSQPHDETTAAESEPKTPHLSRPQVTATTPIDLKYKNETTSTRSVSFQSPLEKLAELTLEEPFTPDQPTPKATSHSSEKKQRLTRAESKRIQLLEEKQHYEIVPLTEEWEVKVESALRSGFGDYKASDLTRVVPLTRGSGGTENWLNDEVINGYLKLIVDHGKQNDRQTQVPTHHAFVSFFYNNLETRGYDAVKRWANRAKIGGRNLLETEYVFIPINSGSHWTLCVVSGKNRTITHYNSLRGNGRRYVETVKSWVSAELGSAWKEEDWKMEFAGESPLQENMDDCGVFTITSARQIMLGLTPMSYGAAMIPLQRRRIVAELVNGELLRSS